jgi:NADP-dependent 3-hydroxy acid dehydrogenase YdfG
MTKSIIVAGYGPGISEAVARKFGKEGYSVALAGRNAERLEKGAESLLKAGIEARAFPTDVGEPGAARELVRRASAALGPVAVLHWNAYAAGQAKDLIAAPDELRTVLDVGVHGLLAALQEALPDLRQQKGAVLVTGGGLAFYDVAGDARAVEWGAMGLAVSKAAQHKLVGLLNKRLAREGVYAGEVTVTGLVKGTPFDSGNATVDPAAVAEAFWRLNDKRDEVYATVG